MGLKRDRGKISFYVLYTAMFCVAALLTFWYFGYYKKSMIWAYDGLYQHYNAFVYLGSWCRELLKNIVIEHNFVLPMWEWGLGYGSDVFTTLSYYTFGDPVALISVFFPVAYAETGYTIAILLRFYIAGIAFCLYSRKMNCESWSTICAAIVYTFCAFAVYFGARHPFFISPMAYFPLILLGCEKIFRKESPVVLILAVFISAISNFYFFYKMAIFTVIYVLVRLLVYKENRKLRVLVGSVFQIGLCAGVGIMFAAILFLPDVMSFLGNTRVTDYYTYPSLYPRVIYEKFVGAFVGVNAGVSSAITGVVPITYLAVAISFFQRKTDEKWTRLFIFVQVLFLLFPVFGHIMNGFGYVSNRWVFVWILTVSFLLAKKLPELFNLKLSERIFLAFGCAIYALFCAFLPKARTKDVFIGLVFLAISLLFVWCAPYIKDFKIKKYIFKETRIKQVIVFALVFVSVGQMAFFRFSQEGFNYLKEFRNAQSANDLLFNERAVAWDLIDDDSFYRIDTATMNNKQYNFAAIDGQSTPTAYWSLLNPGIIQYLELNNAYDNVSHRNRSLQSRAWLLPLMNVKYFVAGGSSNKIKTGVPYGFDLIGEKQGESSKYYLYETKNALPFGFTYDKYITRKDFENMSFFERQQATLQAVVIENEDNTNCKYEENLCFEEQMIKYEVRSDDNIEHRGNSFVVKKNNSKITFDISAPAGCELYLYLDGVNFESKSIYHLNENTDFSESVERKLKYWVPETSTELIANSGGKSRLYHFNDDSMYASGRNEYLFNLGYSENERQKITLEFSETGIYTIEDIKVVCQPVEKISTYVNALSRDLLENVEMTTNKIAGEITLEENKLLCLSLPYTEGWNCYVNGEKVMKQRVNIMFTGVELEAGTHKIELVYNTPYLGVGAVVSLFAVIATVGVYKAYCFQKKKNRN